MVVGTRLASRWMRGRRIIDVIEPGRDSRRVEHLFCASWLAAGVVGRPAGQSLAHGGGRISTSSTWAMWAGGVQ